MDFVASRPCCGCGAAGAGAHITPYIVRHSRLCAHDIYAIPLCQSCQRDIERDRDNWEKTHGRLAMGNDSNLLIVFYVQIMPDDFVMQLHRF